jgi:sortase A
VTGSEVDVRDPAADPATESNRRLLRGLGWTLITLGAVVLLYVVYLLWFTNLETEREQQTLAQEWTLTVTGESVAAEEPDSTEDHGVEVGEAYAALWFERDGEPVVADDVLYVVDDVTVAALKRGPGHYPFTDRPGGAGNFAVAGHRTTYGAPFWAVDELQAGDTIHVVDRDGREWVYLYRAQEIVLPTDVWVIGDDPLDNGRPTITLTTCHPRFSAAQRLIVWGELVGRPLESTGDTAGVPDVLPET